MLADAKTPLLTENDVVITIDNRFIPESSCPRFLELAEASTIRTATSGDFLVKKNSSDNLTIYEVVGSEKALVILDSDDEVEFYAVPENFDGPTFTTRKKAADHINEIAKKNRLPQQSAISSDISALLSASGPTIELFVTLTVMVNVYRALVNGEKNTEITGNAYLILTAFTLFYWPIKWLQTSANLGVRSGVSPKLLKYQCMVMFISAIIPFREFLTDFTALTAAGFEHGLLKPHNNTSSTNENDPKQIALLMIFVLLSATRLLKIALADMANVFRNSGHPVAQRTPNPLRTFMSKVLHLVVDRPMGFLMLMTYLAAWLNIPMLRYYVGDTAAPACANMTSGKEASLPNQWGLLVASMGGVLFGPGEYFLLTLGHSPWLRKALETMFPNPHKHHNYLKSIGDFTDRTGPIYKMMDYSTKLQLRILRLLCIFNGKNPIAERMKLHHIQKSLFRGGMFLGVAAQLFTLFVFGTIVYCRIDESKMPEFFATLATMLAAGLFNGYKEFQEPAREMVFQLCAKHPRHIGVYFMSEAGQQTLTEHLHKKVKADETLTDNEILLQSELGKQTDIILRITNELPDAGITNATAKEFINQVSTALSNEEEAEEEDESGKLSKIIKALLPSENAASAKRLEDLCVEYAKCLTTLFDLSTSVAAEQMPKQLSGRCGIVSWFSPDNKGVPYKEDGTVDPDELIKMQIHPETSTNVIALSGPLNK